MSTNVIIDGTNLCYKYSISPFSEFSNKLGTPTGVAFGILTFLASFRKKFSAKDDIKYHIAFDCPGKLVKHEEGYKQSRKSRARGGEWFKALDVLMGILEQSNIAVYRQEGYEADEIVATLARSMQRVGGVIVISNDKDLTQLIDTNVSYYDWRKQQYFRDRLPFSFIVYHAIIGDACDDIKRVPGISEPDALEFAKKYSTVSALISENTELFKEHEELLKKNARLLTLGEVPNMRRIPGKFNAKEASRIMKYLDFGEATIIKFLSVLEEG